MRLKLNAQAQTKVTNSVSNPAIKKKSKERSRKYLRWSNQNTPLHLMRFVFDFILESPVLIAEISDGVQVSVQRLVFRQRRFHAVKPVQQRLDGVLELAREKQSFLQFTLAVHRFTAYRVPSEGESKSIDQSFVTNT